MNEEDAHGKRIRIRGIIADAEELSEVAVVLVLCCCVNNENHNRGTNHIAVTRFLRSNFRAQPEGFRGAE